MAQNAKKTEHSGAKHGNGAYWGRKRDAKKESNVVRRAIDRAVKEFGPAFDALGKKEH
jgi:hypothetical protein